MQNQGRILRLIVSIISNIVGLILVVLVLNFAYAQISTQIGNVSLQVVSPLYKKTLYEITKPARSSKPGIPVGKFPSAIGVDGTTNRVYVVNAGDNTVSVIDGTTDAVIGKPIRVGNTPLGYRVGVDEATNTIYVANYHDNTVSVINGTTNA